MSTMGLAGIGGGAIAGQSGAGICQEIARQGERALRLRLGGLHLEVRLRRDPVAASMAVAPEWSDGDLERIARHSRRSYEATWEPGMHMTYGAASTLPR